MSAPELCFRAIEKSWLSSQERGLFVDCFTLLIELASVSSGCSTCRVKTVGVGTVLADRYRLDSLLGQGGMGSVWKAHHVALNSPVAIKLMDPKLAADDEGAERFVREAQAAAALRSPHVVQTLDFGVHEKVPFIAMELLQGETLAERLQTRGHLTPAEVVNLIIQIGRAVAKAHDLGIVHRDLKPENIFLVQNEDDEVAKVLDFGIAKLCGSSTQLISATRTGSVMGTPHYMSPEQAEGKAVDPRTDIWALGVISYECMLGSRPFDGEGIGELVLKICARPMPVPSSVGAVPLGFDDWFARACARDREQRFSTVRELIEGLKLLVTGMADAPVDSVQSPPAQPQASLETHPPVAETTPPSVPAFRRTTPWLPIAISAGVGLALASFYVLLQAGDDIQVPAVGSGAPFAGSAAAPLPSEPMDNVPNVAPVETSRDPDAADATKPVEPSAVTTLDDDTSEPATAASSQAGAQTGAATARQSKPARSTQQPPKIERRTPKAPKSKPKVNRDPLETR